MRAPAVTFRDASDTGARMAFPDVVADFEALGFRRVGRLARVYAAGGNRAASAFPERHRARFREQAAMPAEVLAAPDADCFVLVDTWWDAPELQLRTLMADGSIVETRRAWPGPLEDPSKPRGLVLPGAKHGTGRL